MLVRPVKIEPVIGNLDEAVQFLNRFCLIVFSEDISVHVVCPMSFVNV